MVNILVVSIDGASENDTLVLRRYVFGCLVVAVHGPMFADPLSR